MDSNQDDPTARLTPAELELELGRLTLAVDTVRRSSLIVAARRQGLPHPGIEAFLRHCTRLMQRVAPDQEAALVERLERIAAEADLGIVGLGAWLTDPLDGPVHCRRLTDTHTARSAVQGDNTSPGPHASPSH